MDSPIHENILVAKFSQSTVLALVYNNLVVSNSFKGTLPPKIKWGSKRSRWCKTYQVAVKVLCVLPCGRNSTPKMVKPRFG